MNDIVMLDQESLLYLAQVAGGLGDLSDSDRAELLDEVQQHLLAIAEDTGHGTHVDLQGRLGSPSEYAAELRRSAGLPPDTCNELHIAARTIPATTALSEPLASIWRYLRSLTPAWWAVRGYLVSGLILTVAAPIGGSRPTGWRPEFLSPDGPSGSIVGAGPYIVLVILTLIIGSVVVGHTQTTKWTWLGGQGLNLAAIASLVTCPMWWAGPSLYAYYRGRYGS